MLWNRVLIRVDLNTPYLDDLKFTVIQDTVNFYLKSSRHVVLMTHYKNPESADVEYSTRFLCSPLEKIFHEPIEFLNTIATSHAKLAILENTRFFKGEKENSPELAKKFASMGDFFVDEAFAASHKEHASNVGIKEFLPHTLGFNFEMQTHQLKLMASNIKKPILVIIGGNKAKQSIAQALQKKCEMSFLGDPLLGLSNLDISEKRLNILNSLIQHAQTIIWNGPLGKVEEPPYDEGTLKVSEILKKTSHEKTIIMGGGDLVHFLKPKYASFVSTAGGAMLTFIEKLL